MYDEAKALNYEEMQKKAKSFGSAAAVFIAGANTCVLEERNKLYDDLPEPKIQFVIDGATHCFFEKGTAEELAKKTIEWFDKN